MPRKAPVICTECGRVLLYAYNLKRHWISRHVPNELKCRPCFLHFSSTEEAEEHKIMCSKSIKKKNKPLFEDFSEPAQAASTKMNIFAYDHPLMNVPSLDAPAKTPSGRSKRTAKRRNASTTHLIPKQPPTPQRTPTTRSRGKLPQSTSNELKLSDSSDSEEEKGQPKPVPYEDDDDSTKGFSDDANELLEDLKLSSDDDSQQSDTSETTALSDSDDEAWCKPAESLLPGGLAGEGYFWLQPAPGPHVIKDFKEISLSDNPEEAFARFKRLYRDLPADKACLMFADKLKQLPIKRCIELMGVYYRKFVDELLFVDVEGTSHTHTHTFGRIFTTLVHHYYRKSYFEVAGQLLKFLKSEAIDPVKYPPIEKEENCPIGTTPPEEVAMVIMCCTVYFEIRDIDSAVSCLLDPLKEFIYRNNVAALDALKPLLHRMFHEMVVSRNNVPLMKLFKHIYKTQVDTKYPIDLSLFYDGVLSSLVASSQSEQKLAIDLFDSITQFSLLDSESSEIPSRGLLIIAAELRLPRARLAKILMACVNKKAYPSYDFENLSLRFYSSMTKIEMQVYLEQFLFYCAIRIKSGLLKLKPCFTFELIVTTNSVRNYKYPAHPKIVNVDHSHNAALSRLSNVLHHCLNTSSDIPMHHILQPYHGGKFIMFKGVVDQLFRHVLKVDSVESFDEENCVFCYNCT